MKFLVHKSQLFLNSLSKQQNSAIIKGHLSQNACYKNVMKLGYKVKKEK